ncbi:uncharacterized protein LOC110859787 [Folsomia candida]|uniref:uncharacterized protein LOC110859787 n=1 Tax=Folsomia candida TaxID=158441 RepID=UPI000B907A39|nr:uncharacterized protein LOC110859787 [Folsomia candida]
MLSVLLALSPLQLSLLCHPTITFLLVAAAAVQTNKNPEKVFEFPEYDYTETPKNEIAWREWGAACDQTPVCLGLLDLEKVRCVRKCMSPSCYQEIYAFDELEEGEIDIRFHSFKGCFASRIARKRF